MNPTTILSEKQNRHSADTYIEFLSKKIGASREEIIEVTKRSGISARRIAEYLLDTFEKNVDVEE